MLSLPEANVRGRRFAMGSVSCLCTLGILAILLGCPPSNGGVTVPNTDPTPPSITLGFALEGSSTVSGTVSVGGQTQTITLPQKTGKLSLLATGTDPDSGIQSVGIFMEADSQTCTSQGTCSGSLAHGLWSTPNFVSNSGKKNPGDTASPNSVLAESVDLTTLIKTSPVNPGDTVTTKIWVMGQAQNQLNATSQTAEGVAMFVEKK